MNTHARPVSAATLRLLKAGFFLIVLVLAGPAARADNFSWINPAGGDWGNTNNWSPLRATLPGSGDNVSITLGGSYTVTVTTGGNVANLTLGGSGSTPTLYCNNSGVQVGANASAAPGTHIVLTGGDGSSLFGGGSFSANGGLTLDGEIDWLAGSLGGTITVTTNGVIAGSTALNHDYYANIYNHGRILWSANNLTSDGGWLQNESDGLLDFQNDTEFGSFGGAHTPCINNGTLLKSAGTNVLDFYGPNYFTNNGTLVIQTGSFNIDNVADFSGTVVVSNGAALNLVSGTTVLEPGYTFTGPGFYGVPSNVQIFLYGTVTDPNFQMNGSLYGTNTVAGTMNCYDGSFQGTTTVATNGVLNLNGCTSCGGISYTTQTGGTLTNAGTINWLSGDWTTEGGVFVNLSNALFSIQCDNILGTFGGYGNWFNAGTVRKTAGTGTNNFSGATLNNTGLVDVQNGGMVFQLGFTNSGTFNAAGGASILLEYGTYTLNPGSIFTGAGFYGVPQNYSATIFGSIAGANFQMNGSLYGTNILTGTMNAYDGNFEGTTTVTSNGVMNLSGCPNGCGSSAYTTQMGGVLTNAGMVNWLSGYWTDEGGALVNLANALFDIQCDNTMVGGGQWLNQGVIRKSAGNGTNVFSASTTLTNTSLIDVQTGAIQLQSTYSQTGGQLNFGLASPSLYGRLIFSGAAPLTGTLSANLLGGYHPAVGDNFDVLTYPSASGSFSIVTLPALTAGEQWDVLTGASQLILKVLGPSPRLTVASAAGNLTIGWPTNADAGFALQTTTNLAPPILWQPVSNSVQVIGNQNVVILPLTNGLEFFELRE